MLLDDAVAAGDGVVFTVAAVAAAVASASCCCGIGAGELLQNTCCSACAQVERLTGSQHNNPSNNSDAASPCMFAVIVAPGVVVVVENCI